jgi:hypothetical protein
MNAQKIAVKLFLQDPTQAHGLKILPVFQQWIQLHAVEEHMAIDVAEYDHVPDGPGTVLVTLEANLYLDHLDARPGLSYQRKRPLPGTFLERLTTIFRHTLLAAARLEQHPGLRFRTDEFAVKIADRLLAPNTNETFESVRRDLETFALSVLGPQKTLEITHTPGDPRSLFEVTIKSSTSATVSDLLAKLPAPAAV